jgi:hypothetical protein
MTLGYAGISNQANTSSGYALNVSAANSGTLVGVGVSGTGIVDDFSGVVPPPPAGGFIVLEVSGYLVQEVGTTPTNRFELE